MVWRFGRISFYQVGFRRIKILLTAFFVKNATEALCVMYCILTYRFNLLFLSLKIDAVDNVAVEVVNCNCVCRRVQNNVGAGAVFDGQRNGAGVDKINALVFFYIGYMLVSVKTYVAFFEVRRGHLIVEAMTVREEERAGGDYFMIILKSKIGNHLVYFAVAVAFYDDEFARIVVCLSV